MKHRDKPSFVLAAVSDVGPIYVFMQLYN